MIDIIIFEFHLGFVDRNITKHGNSLASFDKSVQLTLPRPMENASLYKYEENLQPKDADGFPVPQETGFHLKGTYKTTLKAQTFQLLTDIQ